MKIKNNNLQEKYNRLIEELKRYNSAAVAFSGGIDSTLLLFAARDALGGNVVALTAASMVFPESERSAASEIAEKINVSHEIVNIDLKSNLQFLKNDKQRCYFCKKIIMQNLKDIAEKKGLEVLLEGSNADDENDYRPGFKAVRELGVISPLEDASLTKPEIIELSKKYNLIDENKSSFSCLATRIAYGIKIERKILERIECLENYLRENGLSNIRVRHHGDIARIETDINDFKRIIKEELRQNILIKFYASGYKYVTLDLEGFLSGSMNK
ncbi:MAG: ATP-dependent sacrificial sulfur transferase LarE [Actinomycetota bacterium]|nr:ATP-dependent sacrificial sulfur transferase LarE [Actinomycetota bacterium]